MRKVAFLLSLMLLDGCGSTAAQVEVKSSLTELKADVAISKQCETEAGTRPEFASLGRRMPIVPDQDVGLEQLADLTRPSPEEVKELEDWHEQVKTCRNFLLVHAQSAYPFLSDALVNNSSSVDHVLVHVIQGNTTWGSINEEMKAVGLQNKERLVGSVRAWLDDEAVEHQAELAQRAATWQAVGNGLVTAAQVYEASRPVRTTCSGGDLTVQCTTY